MIKNILIGIAIAFMVGVIYVVIEEMIVENRHKKEHEEYMRIQRKRDEEAREKNTISGRIPVSASEKRRLDIQKADRTQKDTKWRQRELVRIIGLRANKPISRAKMARELGVDAGQVKYDIRQLITQKRIKFVRHAGGDGSVYKVVKQAKKGTK